MAALRTTARVFPVRPDGAVLLLRELDPQRPADPYWSSIGGGVEPGESLPVAAARELHEEAGIEVAPQDLLGPVHDMEHSFTWDGALRHAHHHYFAVAVPDGLVISHPGLQPEEVDTVLGAGWWTPAGLAGEVYVEPGLPDIVRAAIRAVRPGPGRVGREDGGAR